MPLDVNLPESLSEQEKEAYIDGYLHALQDVADGAFGMMDVVKEETGRKEDICDNCGAEMVRGMGAEGYKCLRCDM